MLIGPSVAGKFYPDNPTLLRQDILSMLDEAKEAAKLPTPKAIIAPHAGYIYSGPIAASAYSSLIKAKSIIKKVVILAPAHQYPIDGIAITKANQYLTPLGQIEIDQKTISTINSKDLHVIDEAFNFEHSLEVQLPFLQSTLEKFHLIPLLVGYATPQQVENVLEDLWDGPETLIVISSDLSHYHSYKTAQSIDNKTAQAIIDLNPDGFSQDDACGATSIKGLLRIAAKKNLDPLLVDLRNSGDTAGSKDQVVGYAAFHFNNHKK